MKNKLKIILSAAILCAAIGVAKPNKAQEIKNAAINKFETIKEIPQKFWDENKDKIQTAIAKIEDHKGEIITVSIVAAGTGAYIIFHNKINKGSKQIIAHLNPTQLKSLLTKKQLITDEEESESFFCDICQRSFKTESGYKRHITKSQIHATNALHQGKWSRHSERLRSNSI